MPGSPPGRVFLWTLICLTGCSPFPEPPDSEPLSDPSPNRAEYVEDSLCSQCHASQFGEWSGSHHDLAMQVATESSVLGDFDDTTFANFGVTSRFFTDGGRFFVNTENAAGEMEDFEIAYTFGVEPLQQYLIELPSGRLQALSIVWDTTGERWFHLYPAERIAPGDPLHWTGRLQNWNLMCAECHSTGLRKNYDAASDTYRTEWSAIDVGCQACHGPGAAHVEWAEDPSGGDSGSPGLNDVSIGDQIDTCAACHSRRSRVSTRAIAGEPFLDHYVPELLREGLYHADGQILDEVYVYGSFLQSRMYQQGVTCNDCHDPHTLELRAAGNDLCVRCHNATAPARFPALARRDYATPAHHFHPADSTGAECVNCHMPARTYMVVDPRRDHSFRVPRPDLTIALGTPNACNGCHDDRPPSWANDALFEWYGPKRPQSPHYGEALTAGRRGDTDALPRLMDVAGDTSMPGIVRATALFELASHGGEGRDAFLAGLRDTDPLVRRSAVSGLENFGLEDRVEMLVPLLSDPVRSVRLESARVLAPASGRLASVSSEALLTAALAEYEELQISLADTPEAHMNLGILHAAARNRTRALEDYRRVLEMQPGFLPASLNLATLLNELGRNAEAEQVLVDAIGENPGAGDLHYSLGLIRAETNRLGIAVEDLERATGLLPDRPRIRYNYALALQRLGRRAEAEDELLEANRIGPDDPDIVQALAVFYVQEGRPAEALLWAERWAEMLPGQPGPREFLEGLRRQSR